MPHREPAQHRTISRRPMMTTWIYLGAARWPYPRRWEIKRARLNTTMWVFVVESHS